MIRVRAGQDEAATAWLRVHRPFDGAQNFGDFLPLIQQYWLGEAAQRGVRVRAEDLGLARLIKSHNGFRMLNRRRCLTGRPQPLQRHRRQFAQ